MADDGYYSEICIFIDGWQWNLRDAPLPKSPPLAASGATFPSAQRLLSRWERDHDRPARRAA